MTAEHPEAPTCTQCNRPSKAVLKVQSLGSGTVMQYGNACWQPISEPHKNWKIFIH